MVQGRSQPLAIGWLTYHYIKWCTQPTAERYLCLPNCMQPTPEQIQSLHPGCLDVILWKKLRKNILKNHAKYDIVKLIQNYCSCLKLGWLGGEDFLVPEEKNKHSLRPEFVRCFMSEDGWGLKSEFLSHYPEFLRIWIYGKSSIAQNDLDASI
ncbi:hypothetical protein B0T10DRAFT_572004 [Thelonectria olida]|uniref:Uncharacterized protein n=1 Tax=Thelonectria olida TaxID=1576542 RepID=A0A9P8W744_9HYPO|nr:hypothetical protein B0T10DRAFT_572004 [Thelonectria olida]